MYTLFAILQKYDFSSKSQPKLRCCGVLFSCLRYCKSTIFQANHNRNAITAITLNVVCDTAKVRFFKQITTLFVIFVFFVLLFAILQKYDFSSKSQLVYLVFNCYGCCLRYCKSTIFQANHNNSSKTNTALLLFAILQKYDFSSKSQRLKSEYPNIAVVCDTAKVRFFKQITTPI